MTLHYRDIFFDLDHTLWDYDTNARETLNELYDRYELSSISSLKKDVLSDVFFEVNEGLWNLYDKGKISKYFLRTQRFKLVFDQAGIDSKMFGLAKIDEFANDYLNECPHKTNLIEGTLNLLEALNGLFQLHIITNGFVEVQNTKLEKSGLLKYFKNIITSEQAKAKKPFPKIFEFAMNKANATPARSIMIGDNLITDIKGARDFGMDQIYFNSQNKPHNELVSFEITELTEVLEIIGQ